MSGPHWGPFGEGPQLSREGSMIIKLLTLSQHGVSSSVSRFYEAMKTEAHSLASGKFPQGEAAFRALLSTLCSHLYKSLTLDSVSVC